MNCLKYRGYRINYINSAFIIINHVLALYSLQYIDSVRKFLDVIILYQLGGMSITSGSHRLWSHRSYKAKDLTRFILMLFIST